MSVDESPTTRSEITLDPSSKELLLTHCKSLAPVLAKAPATLSARIKECISYNLPVRNRGEYHRKSFHDQLCLLLEDDKPATFIVRMLEWADLSTLKFLEQELNAEPDVLAFLRDLYITFGHAFSRASRAQDRPKDWHRLALDALYDDEKNPMVALTIERNDGECLELVGSVRSMARLQSSIIARLSESFPELPNAERSQLKDLHSELARWLERLGEKIERREEGNA